MFGINTQVNWKYKLIHFENTLLQTGGYIISLILPWLR